SSVSFSPPSGLTSASVTAFSISAGLCALSKLISRGVCCTPILTSTATASSPVRVSASRLAGRAGPQGRQVRCGQVLQQREVGDAGTGQRLRQVDGLRLGHPPLGATPTAVGVFLHSR